MKKNLIIKLIILNLFISSIGVYEVSQFNFMSEIGIKHSKHVELELQNEHKQKIKTHVTSNLFGVDIEYKNEVGDIVHSSRLDNETAFLFILIIVLNCLVSIIWIYDDFRKVNGRVD